MSSNLPTKVPTPDTTPASTSLMYIVDDPYGTPADNAATAANVVTKAHGLSDGFQQVVSGTMTTKSAADTKTDLSLTSSDVGLGNVTNNAQLKASDLDTDGTLAANSDTKIPSQKAVKTYVDTSQAILLFNHLNFI